MSSTITTRPAEAKVTGSPAAAQVVKNLTANAPTVEATQPSPLEKATAGKPLVKAAKARKEPSKVTAETAKKARQAGSTDELLALARKRLPQNEDTLLVTFTVRQANVVLDALQFFSKYAPDLGSEDLNQAHDAAVYTAYYAAYDELDAPDVRGTKNARKRRSTALISEGQWAEDPSLAVSEPAKAKATAPEKEAVKAA